MPRATEQPAVLLRPQEVADLLQVQASFVYRLAREGKIPVVRLGKRYVRFQRSAVDRWLEEQSR